MNNLICRVGFGVCAKAVFNTWYEDYQELHQIWDKGSLSNPLFFSFWCAATSSCFALMVVRGPRRFPPSFWFSLFFLAFKVTLASLLIISIYLYCICIVLCWFVLILSVYIDLYWFVLICIDLILIFPRPAPSSGLLFSCSPFSPSTTFRDWKLVNMLIESEIALPFLFPKPFMSESLTFTHERQWFNFKWKCSPFSPSLSES